MNKEDMIKILESDIEHLKTMVTSEAPDYVIDDFKTSLAEKENELKTLK